MGTERSNEYSGPCSCGTGICEIDYCTPDHGWPVAKQEWNEAHIQCAACAKQYEIHRFGSSFYLVSFAELEAKEQKKQAVYAAANALNVAAMSRGVQASLIKFLDAQQSAAAKHRILVQAGLTHESLPTFRKRWSGAQTWINSHFSGYMVGKAMKALGITDPQLEASIKELEFLQEQSNQPLTPVGKPIYSIPK
jgi:hypothetical protein